MKYIDAEQIRAEIERRFWDYGTPLHDEEVTKKVDEILDFIDTLPEQPVGDTDGKAMLYVANKSYKIGYRDGKASKEQSVEGLEDEFETEADKTFFANGWYEGDHHQPRLDISLEEFRDIARHFAEWGAKHLKK